MAPYYPNYVDTDYQYWHQQNEIWAWQTQNQSEVQDRQMGENHYMNQDWSPPGYIQNQPEVQDSRMVQNHLVYQGWAPQVHIQNQPEFQNHPVNQVWTPQEHIQNHPQVQNHPVNQVWAHQGHIQNQSDVQDRQLIQIHQETHQRQGKKRQIQNTQQNVTNDSKKGYKFYCEQCRQWFKTDVHFKRGKCNCEYIL